MYITPEMEERKIVKLPNILEFTGYVLFAPGCVMGPFFEFSDYKNFIEFKGHYTNLPRGLCSGI